jgi:hypothetical protein
MENWKSKIEKKNCKENSIKKKQIKTCLKDTIINYKENSKTKKNKEKHI